MTPKEVKKYYKTLYRFNKATGMSCSTLHNWIKWGFVPLPSQIKLEKLTDRQLIAGWHREDIK